MFVNLYPPTRGYVHTLNPQIALKYVVTYCCLSVYSLHKLLQLPVTTVCRLLLINSLLTRLLTQTSVNTYFEIVLINELYALYIWCFY